MKKSKPIYLFYKFFYCWVSYLFILSQYCTNYSCIDIFLPEPDSFLESFNGSDINGIEDVVKKINRCDERWRKDAESRIDKNRKHNFHLQFIKSDGQPYSNEKVRVKLVKHAFKFGVALKYPYFSESNLLEDHISERVLSHDWAFDIDQRFKLINQFSTEVGLLMHLNTN